jgi:hypothetical protein
MNDEADVLVQQSTVIVQDPGSLDQKVESSPILYCTVHTVYGGSFITDIRYHKVGAPSCTVESFSKI